MSLQEPDSEDMRKTYASAVIIVASFLSTAVNAGPLTNIFLNSLDGHGEASWSEGYQEGHKETLSDVVLRMDDGRRYDIDHLTISYSGNSIILDAENVKMNPEGDLLLLRAGRVYFKGHAGLLQTFWTHEMIEDACAYHGVKNELQVENFGMILSGGEDLLAEDYKYRAKSFGVQAETSGNFENCKVAVDLSASDYEANLSDGSSAVAAGAKLRLNIPGSLASLVADPSQAVTVHAEFDEFRDLISGGATAWSVGRAIGDAEFSALSIVPALTLTLKYKDLGYGAEYWMRLWNTFNRMHGDGNIHLESMTARSANILPPEYVTRFTDAGLTTLLLDLDSDFNIAGKSVDWHLDLNATGLMVAEMDSSFQFGSYPAEVIARQSVRPGRFDRLPPIHINTLEYAHSDDGLIDSAANIMGVPVTVRINQIREVKSSESPAVAHIIRDIATDAANFAALSYRNPPARLQLSINEGLNLREAMIISEKAPQEITNIFSYEIGSGPKEAQ